MLLGPVQGTRREARRRRVFAARRAGRYGPRWWEVAPGFAGVGLAVAASVAVLAWTWSHLTSWAAAAAVLLGLLAGLRVRAVVLQRRRRVPRVPGRPASRVPGVPARPAVPPAAVPVRPRRVLRTVKLATIDTVDDTEYRRIVSLLLRRDGWTQLREVPVGRSRHVTGVGRSGVPLGLACERGDDVDDDTGHAAALRPVAAADASEHVPGVLYVIVSTGRFERSRVLWAARSGVHLVDRALLARWAAGEHLAELLDLDVDRPAPAASA